MESKISQLKGDKREKKEQRTENKNSKMTLLNLNIKLDKRKTQFYVV